MDKKAIRGMKAKQCLFSSAYNKLYLGLSSMLSYRNVSMTMDRFLHRGKEHETKVSTLEDRVELQGRKLSATYMEESVRVLKTYEVDHQTGIIDKASPIATAINESSLPPVLNEATKDQLVADYNQGRDENTKLDSGAVDSIIEASVADCCYVTIDDVGVKSQKVERNESYKKEQKFIENTVIHVQKGDLQYTLTAIGMEKAFLQLVAFLLSNNLMKGCRLVFLTDGAMDIRDNIEKFFGFRQYTLILDWFHLKKKCGELLSMILKGKKEKKNEIKQELTDILWTGKINEATKYLDGLNKSIIKNTKKFDELKGYLERKSPNLTCYALRHHLGLRISSNRVEKANDLVVANRQKHNGMAWSKAGSGSLAAITAAKLNGELDNWIETGKIRFSLVA